MVAVLDRTLDVRAHEDELYELCRNAQTTIDQKQSETERFRKALLVYVGAEIAKEHQFKQPERFDILVRNIGSHEAHWFGYVFSEGSDHLRRQGMIATRNPAALLKDAIDTQDALYDQLDRDDYTDAPRLLSRLHTAHRIAYGHKENPVMASIGAEIQGIVFNTYSNIDKNKLLPVLLPHITTAKDEMKKEIIAKYQSRPG
jgi:hypothetical protein